eukprot:scaffold409398_cov28-Prasinocladus_malaysianus.AAC.1
MSTRQSVSCSTYYYEQPLPLLTGFSPSDLPRTEGAQSICCHSPPDLIRPRLLLRCIRFTGVPADDEGQRQPRVLLEPPQPLTSWRVTAQQLRPMPMGDDRFRCLLRAASA